MSNKFPHPSDWGVIMRNGERLICLMTAALLCALTGCAPSAGQADRQNTFELLTAAAAAGNLEDSAFLFYAAQMRFQIDTQVYPPIEKGADSPVVLKAALSSTIGQTIGPALVGNPTAQADAMKRLAAWTPSFHAGYDPGWKYQNPVPGNAAAIVAAARKQILQPLQSKTKLAENAEYVRLGKELAEVDAEMQKMMAVVTKPGGQPLTGQSLKEYQAAADKKATIAKRMKEIEWQLNPESRWHPQVGWKAEDFFDDPQVIALCRAIEANDVEEMERLIAAGANVKSVGKDGMTPLLWAFPDRKLERFECLLRHGADSNVLFKSDFGVGSRPFHPFPVGGSLFVDRGCHAGQSVTHLACRSPVFEYLQSVMAHGGNANLLDSQTEEAPLNISLDRHMPDMDQRVELLLSKGANPNYYCSHRSVYPAMQAVQNGRYDIAKRLLKAGADPQLYQPDGERKLIHVVFREQRNVPHLLKQRAAEYQALVDWLEQHGESLAQAEKDEQKWAAMYKNAFTPEMHGRIRQRIIAEREQKKGQIKLKGTGVNSVAP